MSASSGPTGAELLYDKLIPLYGTPMLSMMLATSPEGIFLRIAVSRQQIFRHRRHDCPREQVRSQHSEYHGFGHRYEEVPRDARQQKHRDEHDANTERRNEGWDRDLLGPVQDGLLDVFLHGKVPV